VQEEHRRLGQWGLEKKSAREYDGDMPEISRFLGITIQMFFGDHPAPHYHATYGGQTAKIQISQFGVVAGRLPPKVLALLAEWTLLHEEELLAAFARAEKREDPGTIEPLV